MTSFIAVVRTRTRGIPEARLQGLVAACVGSRSLVPGAAPEPTVRGWSLSAPQFPYLQNRGRIVRSIQQSERPSERKRHPILALEVLTV